MWVSCSENSAALSGARGAKMQPRWMQCLNQSLEKVTVRRFLEKAGGVASAAKRQGPSAV